MMVFCNMKPNVSIHEIAKGSRLNTLKVNILSILAKLKQ
jgi:hypothetical protein